MVPPLPLMVPPLPLMVPPAAELPPPPASNSELPSPSPQAVTMLDRASAPALNCAARRNIRLSRDDIVENLPIHSHVHRYFRASKHRRWTILYDCWQFATGNP